MKTTIVQTNKYIKIYDEYRNFISGCRFICWHLRSRHPPPQAQKIGWAIRPTLSFWQESSVKIRIKRQVWTNSLSNSCSSAARYRRRESGISLQYFLNDWCFWAWVAHRHPEKTTLRGVDHKTMSSFNQHFVSQFHLVSECRATYARMTQERSVDSHASLLDFPFNSSNSCLGNIACTSVDL